MNKQIKRNTAILILLGMYCSIFVAIIGALKSEIKTEIVPATTVIEVTAKPNFIYSFNISTETNKILLENIVNTDEPRIIKNENPLVQSENVKLKNLAKDGTEYKYYKIVDGKYETTLDYELQEYTYDLCVEYGITEYFTLILSQLYKESAYKYDVISKTNDWGIAQINICNHEWLKRELGITDFLDPRQSILCNIYLMSRNLEKYSVESSLICYNAGRPNSTNPYAQQYAKDIIGYWNNCVVEIQKE